MSTEMLLDFLLILGIGMVAFVRLMRSAAGATEVIGPLRMFVWLISTYFVARGVLSLLMGWRGR